MLDRDELAAWLAVALAGRSDQFSSVSLADDAVVAADALLARLRPEAVAPAPSRPEWVRVTHKRNGNNVTVGKAYRVNGWTSRGAPYITADDGWVGWSLSANGAEPDSMYDTFASWEPCAAPSPAERAAAGLPPVDDPALEIALIDAVARVESGLWENFDACRRRRIVVDAVLPVIRARLKANGGAS